MRRPPIFAGLALVAAYAFASCGGRATGAERVAERRSEQARQLARRAGLSPTVQEFLALYAANPGRRASVTYAVEGGPGGGTVRVDQDPPRRRVDVTAAGGGDVHSLFQTASGAFVCARLGGDWTCQPSAEGAGGAGVLAPGDVSRTVDALTSSRGRYTFSVGHRRMAGRSAECLVTSPVPGSPAPQGPQSLCIAGTGTPLLIESSGQTLRATRYSPHVDGSRFRLPARLGA